MESFMDKSDTKSKEDKQLEKLLQEKQQLLQRQSQEYLNQLFESNENKPVSVSNIQVNNAKDFRLLFLNKQFLPLNKDNFTLQEFFGALDEITRNFTKAGVVENLVIQLDAATRPNNVFFKSVNQDTLNLIPAFNLFPVKKFYAKTGSNIGNGEGDGYIQFQLKNLFGGGENVSFDATTGTRTSSSYLFNYNMPVNNNTNYVWESLFFINHRSLEWIGCETKNYGFNTKFATKFSGNVNHQLAFDGIWRILNNKNSKSLSIWNQCGHNFKNSVTYNISYDTRDNIHLPSMGKLMRLGIEIDGLTRFSSNTFVKTLIETQVAQKLTDQSHFILTNRFGIINSPKESYVLDRFFIGGPNDVRSFTLNGLGPKSYGNSIGGDLFVNGGLSLITRIPYTPQGTNFKLHSFFNYGNLKLYDQEQKIYGNLTGLFNQFSTSFGIGILYNHPMARFELNFVLPLTTHQRDFTRKGLQYGIGVSFL